jgi:hypothetical protein
MSTLRSIEYKSRSDTTAETKASVLCAVYKFVLDRNARKEAAPESRPDGTKVKEDSANEHRST